MGNEQRRYYNKYWDRTSLWSYIVFWERGNFLLKYLNLKKGFRPDAFFNHLKIAHNCVTRPGCFFFHCSLFHCFIVFLQLLYQFIIVCLYWDTPSENTSLWQLPNLSSTFIGQRDKVKTCYDKLNYLNFLFCIKACSTI